MGDLSQWESKKYLVEVSGATERQITRWHAEGIIPKPRQRSLGRGRGTETVYPIGTAKQLLELVRIRSKNRRLSHIAWRLWWQGYIVEMGLIRDFLDSSVRNWGKGIGELFDARKDQLKPKARKSIKASLNTHRKSEHLRRAKNAAGEGGISGILHLLLQINTGRYRSNSENAEVDRFKFEKLLGLEPDELDPLGIKPRLGEHSLDELSRLFGKTSWTSVIQKSSDQELMRARDEITQMLMTLESFSIAAEGLYGKKMLWLSLLSKWLRQVDQRFQALLIVFWRILGASKLREGMEQVLNACRVWVEIALPQYQALEQLKREVPSLSDDVTKIMRAAVSNGESDGTLQSRLRNLRKKHEKELDAFWERHPEYTALATEI
jgi:hypothetical protein